LYLRERETDWTATINEWKMVTEEAAAIKGKISWSGDTKATKSKASRPVILQAWNDEGVIFLRERAGRYKCRRAAIPP
jgi:hypothetical protein